MRSSLSALSADSARIEARPGARRALALDALRGLFLLLMTFGFSIADGVYPAWMYHRQEPPPTHEFVQIAGLTWRDLTFPAFLFTLAAALPITFGLRIARGAGARQIAVAALRRWFLLYVFALIVAHSSGYWIHEYSWLSRMLSLCGFSLLCLIFTRRQDRWNPRVFAALRALGWSAAIAYLAFSPLLYGSSFDLMRHDEILAELGFASAVGIGLWYATRGKLGVRLLVLAGVCAVSLSAQIDSWISQIWWGSPVPWLFEVSSLKLLCVVVPGTIAGDLLVDWMGAPPGVATPRWSRPRCIGIALCGCAFAPVLVVGLYEDRLVAPTALAVFGLCGVALALVAAPASDGERLVRALCRWAVVWLCLGMLLEPCEGGIAKVPGTLSYWFSTAGNALMLLAALVCAFELLDLGSGLRWLVEVGQNPLLGYVFFTLFLEQVTDLIPPLRDVLCGSPAELLVRSLLSLAIVAGCLREATRRDLVWRA